MATGFNSQGQAAWQRGLAEEKQPSLFPSLSIQAENQNGSSPFSVSTTHTQKYIKPVSGLVQYHTPMIHSLPEAPLISTRRLGGTSRYKPRQLFIYSGALYCSAFKKKEIQPFAATWMDMKDIMLNKISQTQKSKHYLISLTCSI